MARQLAVIPGVPDLEIDTIRTALKAERRPRVHLPVVGQPELKPDPANAKPVNETQRRRQIAESLVEYLEAVPRAEIRSRRHRISAPRILREGLRPESLGTGRLTERERSDLKTDVFIAEAFGDKFGPPEMFGKCGDGPCVHASCRHSLLIEIGASRGGKPPAIKLNHPGREPDELKETCSLRAAMKAAKRKDDPDAIEDVAMSFEEIAELLNITRERARQIADGALAKLGKRKPEMKDWR